MSKTYNLFISHSWAYADTYENLINLLDERAYFSYNNFSVSKDNPIHTRGTDKELYEAIKRKILPCNVVLIMAGVYATYSKWIQKEIEIAKREFSVQKPIIAIKPRGSTKVSTIVTDNANFIVAWNTEAVVNAIRELG